MKRPVAAVIIALSFSPATALLGRQEESLAAIARAERDRREAAGRVAEGQVTNENIRRQGIPVVIGRIGEVVPGVPAPGAGAEEPDADAAASEAGASGTDEQDPQEALAAQRRRVQELQDEELTLQLEVNRFRAAYQAPVVSQREQTQALQQMASAQASLEDVRAELTAAREQLQALEAAAAAEPQAGP